MGFSLKRVKPLSACAYYPAVCRMLAPRGFCCCWNAPQRRLVARTATRLVLEQYQPLRSVNTSRAGGGVEPEMRVATLAPAVARAVLLLPSPPPRRLRDCVLPSRQRSCRYARELCAAAHTLVSCSWPAPPFGSPRWWVTCFQLPMEGLSRAPRWRTGERVRDNGDSV